MTKPVSRFAPSRFAADVDDDAAKCAIVHVERTRPEDLRGIEIESVAVEEMRIDQRREQIVRSGDGVEVASESGG